MAEIRFSKGAERVSLINADEQPNNPPSADNSPPATTSGLNVFTTCVFIVGVIAGSGFLTLPKAIDDSGWIGFVLILFCCFVSAYTGNILGKCWVMILDRHPEFTRGQIRYPYPAIGEEAFGKVGRSIVSFSINFTQFGSTIVYILLSAENIVTLLPSDTQLTCCYIALIVGGAMTPFTWLATPKDFWGIAAAATFATSAASIILFISVLYNGRDVDISDVIHTKVDVISFFTAYGTICFAFNGHPAFPTFQSDMANPKKFGSALILGYSIVLFMYMPSSAAAYAVYGSKVRPNVLYTIPTGVTSTMVSLLMCAHLLFGIIIVINPVSQELEHLFNIPEHFTWKRVLARTLTMVAALFVVASVPHFSSILSLVGGSTISILAFICPCLFYLKLCKGDKNHDPVPIPLHTKVLMYEIIFIGVVAGIAATYSAITDLAVNKFTVPCYVDPNRACAHPSTG